MGFFFCLSTHSSSTQKLVEYYHEKGKKPIFSVIFFLARDTHHATIFFYMTFSNLFGFRIFEKAIYKRAAKNEEVKIQPIDNA